MGSIQNTVSYCCVFKGDRILYAYSCGDPEIENLAVLCLERAPTFHTWYFQTVRKRTFGFLMEDGYVFFTIVDEGLGNPGVLQFLEHVRDEFKKIAKNGSKGNLSGLNTVCLQEQLVPIIRHLISSLEHVSQSDGNWMAEIPSSHHLGPSSSSEVSADSQIEVVASTKAPLLGKFGKQEKKKMKERTIESRDDISEEHRKSMDRGIKIEMTDSESNNQGMMLSPISLQKGSTSMRIRTGSQHARKAWWRQVRIVLAIDAIACLILFVIWLGICGGFHCISH